MKRKKSLSRSKKSPIIWSRVAKIAIPILLVILSIFLFMKFRRPADIIVHTNAFFAPFEFYKGNQIIGVDVDIMNRVGQKLNKTVAFTNVEFSAIIDNVEKGKVCDVGAAGITITEKRAEKVNFSIPYYTSVQYVIYPKDISLNSHPNYFTWQDLTGKTIGVQTDTTGWIFTNDEINSGSLQDTNTVLKNFDSAELAADGIKSHLNHVVIVDELPAKYIVDRTPQFACLPLYQATSTDTEPVQEQYAIAVNKDQPELLSAINETLSEMLVRDSSGYNEIEKLVLKYMDLSE